MVRRLGSLLKLISLVTLGSLLVACQQVPSPLPSAPSKKEAEVGKNYMGKSFVTIEDGSLSLGPFPELTRRRPDGYDKLIFVPAGTRFVVQRVELNQGATRNAILGIAMFPFGGAPLASASKDVLYLDLYLGDRVHRDVQMELMLGLNNRPRFRPAPE